MKKNYFWIDLLKSLAAFAVIILHVSVPIVYRFEEKEIWWAGNFYNSLVRFSVPIFVMISGVLSVNVVVASVGIFIAFKDVIIKNEKIIKGISFISKYSYGIYLSHIFVLIMFAKIGFSYDYFNYWISIPIIAISCFTLSLLLTFLLSKIPFIGKYISG